MQTVLQIFRHSYCTLAAPKVTVHAVRRTEENYRGEIQHQSAVQHVRNFLFRLVCQLFFFFYSLLIIMFSS